MHRGRESVVRGLAHVDMIVGVDRLLRTHLAAHDLDGAVRDHLVRVHVRLGAGTSLPDHQREMIVQLARDHLARGLDHRAANGGVQLAGRHVHLRRRLFHHAQRADDGDRLLFPADLEVAQGPLGLRAPIAVGRNFQRAEAVGFGAGVGHGLILWQRRADNAGVIGRKRRGINRYAVAYRCRFGRADPGGAVRSSPLHGYLDQKEAHGAAYAGFFLA